MTTSRILLLGSDGQVGWELQRALAPLGEVVSVDRKECDLADGHAVRDLLARTSPELVVNAAAYTAVDKAEQDAETARLLNAELPAILAQDAAARSALLVHYSTDYVFDGRKATPYVESDQPNPLSVYGETKWQGEQAILALPCRHLIFRTSWVFAARGGNFAKTMLRLAAERDSLNVIADQIGAPTSAELLADATAHAIRALQNGAAGGLYHLVAGGETSWHGYARFVIEQAQARGLCLKAGPDAIQPIPTSAYPLPAQRPSNSRLNTEKFQTEFKLHLPPWQFHVQRMLDELYGTKS